MVVDRTRVALPLEAVDRVLRAALLQPAPPGAGCLIGALDIAGDIVPVYSLRRLLGLAARPLRASDRMVLTRAPARAALAVDDVAGTAALDAVELTGETGLRAAGLRGVARGAGGLLLVHDLARLLALQRAIPIGQAHG